MLLNEDVASFKEKYGENFHIRLIRDDDGIAVDAAIKTRFPKKDEKLGECPYEVWEHDSNTISALVPRKTARKILNDYKRTELYLDTDEGMVLNFPLSELTTMINPLKIRKRYKQSPERREKTLRAAEKGRRILMGFPDEGL